MATRNWFTKQAMKFVASPPGAWLYLNVIPVIDRPLLRLTGGRLSVSVGQPVLLLESTGAKSGMKRETPLVYTADGDRVVLIASAGGSPKHPAWYHNIKANPECEITLGGRKRRCIAREAEGEERGKLWAAAVDGYPGFETYQERAGNRRIPVMIIEDAPAH